MVCGLVLPIFNYDIVSSTQYLLVLLRYHENIMKKESERFQSQQFRDNQNNQPFRF